MVRMSSLTPADFANFYQGFDSPVSRFDCGRKCAPLNGGEPVCCSTQNAVPVAERAEWNLLRSRTDLWGKFKPYDAPTRKIVAELETTCVAIECKGVAHCERENRTIACRAFPLFPYINRRKEFIGLSVYWDFEDRCWMMSNLQVVDKIYVAEFVDTFEKIFAKDQSEFDTYVTFSASMRRVFSRWQRLIPLIGRDGSHNVILPGTGEMKPIRPGAHAKQGPFKSEAAYRRAIKAEGGTVPPEGLVAI
jgi:hypothetical protein